MIAILDYGAGNLRSVRNTLDEVGAAYVLAAGAPGLREASKIILPGVGHFGQMMRALGRLEVRGPLLEAIRRGVPFLGICLGMQALFDASEEAEEERGFGLFPGLVKRFPPGARVPHMGWNRVVRSAHSRLIAESANPYFYFAHSFYAPLAEATAAVCEYGVAYSAALESGNVFGVQFHPEKSGSLGLDVMRRFVSL